MQQKMSLEYPTLTPLLVVTIEGRKIVQWRDYMDSLAAMTALSQVQ
jgi:limonene-1,2-epoxide hydrolase